MEFEQPKNKCQEKSVRIIDPLAMQMNYLIQQATTEKLNLKKLKEEFRKFSSISLFLEARNMIYSTYPRFRESKSFMNFGVKYFLYDMPNTIRLLAWFPDEIICYEYKR